MEVIGTTVLLKSADVEEAAIVEGLGKASCAFACAKQEHAMTIKINMRKIDVDTRTTNLCLLHALDHRVTY